MWPKRLWNASMVGLVVKKRQGRVSASDLNAGLWKQERKKKTERAGGKEAERNDSIHLRQDGTFSGDRIASKCHYNGSIICPGSIHLPVIYLLSFRCPSFVLLSLVRLK